MATLKSAYGPQVGTYILVGFVEKQGEGKESHEDHRVH